MDITLIPILADAMNQYYDSEELIELCGVFDIEYELDHRGHLNAMRLAKELIERSEHGNNRRFLDSIVPSLAGRASRGVARSTFERRDHHESMSSSIYKLETALRAGSVPTEISVPENQPFFAKSEVREFLESADTRIIIVDNYVGTGTLDCLRGIQQEVQLLTGQQSGSIETGFERVLEEYRSEGYSIKIKRHPRLHDRHIIFNDRCWILGSSLKHAGQKKFNAIECVDSKENIMADVAAKWDEASEYDGTSESE